MDMTGWIHGQVFLQTVDEAEVQIVTAFLSAHGLAFQVLTLSERISTGDGASATSVSSDRFSIAVQLGGFPQVVTPVLTDLIQRAHGAGWEPNVP